ncbi:hypothetical protein [Plantactinospora sp. B24E8]|uniref:hypothetical protein n=1 Tax=Plantactinospora sp. B24E8 TaxID=3153567 RepID=UPI00325EDE4C
MRLRRDVTPPYEPALSAEWTAALDDRPEVERALIRAVLTAHRLVSPDPPPPPHEVPAADRLYQLHQIRPHTIVDSVAGLRAAELRDLVQPEYVYLFSTMASSEPRQQDVADHFGKAAEAAAGRDRAFRPWRPVASLLRAAHYARGDRFVEATGAVDAAIGQLAGLRRIDRAVREGVRVAAEAARPALRAAVDGQALPERRRAEIDDTSYELDLEGRRRYARDDFDAACRYFDRALEVVDEWYVAMPGDARAIRALAMTTGNRLMCLIEMSRFVDAAADGGSALELFDLLCAEEASAPPTPFAADAADAQVRFAVALAGTVADFGDRFTGPEPLEVVRRHALAGVEAIRRIGGRDADERLGRALALSARAFRLLDVAVAVDGEPDPAVEAAALAVEAAALEFYRSRDNRLDLPERRNFAQTTFTHAVAQLNEDDEAARDAGADFLRQAEHLVRVGLPVHPGADRGQRVEELGYVEYIIGRSKLQLGDRSFGQHIVNAQYILDQHPGPLSGPMPAIKAEIDEFVAARRREGAAGFG